MGSKAFAAFETLMGSVDELVAIHGKVQSGQGRRHRQEALHRAGVVLIVAAWQAYIEKLSNETLDLIENSLIAPKKGGSVPAWVKSAFYFRKPSVRQSIGSLNTPNTQNVTRLFDWSFGYDPKSSWTWYSPRRKWDSSKFCERTDEWLKIRHTIAHGNELPKNLAWLKNSAGTPRLNLSLLKEAQRHFGMLARLTDKGMAKHLASDYSIKTKW